MNANTEGQLRLEIEKCKEELRECGIALSGGVREIERLENIITRTEIRIVNLRKSVLKSEEAKDVAESERNATNLQLLLSEQGFEEDIELVASMVEELDEELTDKNEEIRKRKEQLEIERVIVDDLDDELEKIKKELKQKRELERQLKEELSIREIVIGDLDELVEKKDIELKKITNDAIDTISMLDNNIIELNDKLINDDMKSEEQQNTIKELRKKEKELKLKVDEIGNLDIDKLLNIKKRDAGFLSKREKWIKDISDVKNHITEESLDHPSDDINKFNKSHYIKHHKKILSDLTKFINDKNIGVANNSKETLTGDRLEAETKKFLVDYIDKLYSEEEIDTLYKADTVMKLSKTLDRKIVNYIYNLNGLVADKKKTPTKLRKELPALITTKKKKIFFILGADRDHGYEDIRWWNGIDKDSELLIDTKAALEGEITGSTLSYNRSINESHRPLWYVKADYIINDNKIIVIRNIKSISIRTWAFEKMAIYGDGQYKISGVPFRKFLLNAETQLKAALLGTIRGLDVTTIKTKYISFLKILDKTKNIDKPKRQEPILDDDEKEIDPSELDELVRTEKVKKK